MQAVVSKYQMRALLLGPSGGGKTQMIVTERFPQIEAPVRPTIWIKLTAPLPDRMLNAQRPADETHEMVAVDTRGWTYGLTHLTRDVLKPCEIVVYVCKVSDRISLKGLSEYVDKTRRELGAEWNQHCHLLVATHGDLPKSLWQVSERDLDTFALIHRLTALRDHTIISAKDPAQVKAVFDAAFLAVYSVTENGVVRNPGFGSFPTDRMPANSITAALPSRAPTRTFFFEDIEARAARLAAKRASDCGCNGPSAAGSLTRKSDAVGYEANEKQNSGAATETRMTATTTPPDASADLSNNPIATPAVALASQGNPCVLM